MAIDTVKILEDAEVAAIFLRALTDKGTPMAAAVSITAAYLNSRAFVEGSKDVPREPWQGPEK